MSSGRRHQLSAALLPAVNASSSSGVAASTLSSVAASLLLPHQSSTTTASAAGTASSASAEVVEHNPYALVLALIPMLTIFGNSMVILAVRREKSLQTVTNYLIVSLASADLLVATCVMFFAVYFEWNSFVWDLGPTLCNLYIGADVACSTASILNLLAISIDRYIAISHPLAYCQIGTKNSRAYLSIALVWSVSIAVAVPVAFGANHIEQDTNECSFTNPVFMIGSSLLSFFVPCLAMIALYAVIFRRLREREKARDMRKRGPTLGVDNALILNALMGGARMARQIAKHHLKDQLLLELSMQTSSFPSPSEEEEEEEEEEPDQSESEASSQIRHKLSRMSKISTSHYVSSHHKLSASNVDQQNLRRPTFCLMLNGGTGMPFPLAPMNPLSLPRSGLENGNGDCKRPRRPSKNRKRAAALLLRRCNTLPTAVLRRPLLHDGGKDGRRERAEVSDFSGRELSTNSVAVDDEPFNEVNNNNNNNNDCTILAQELRHSRQSMHLAESAELLGRGDETTPGVLGRRCSKSASQFSLRDCPSFWHDDELSTQRSFGEGLQEELPFIDTGSSYGSSSSSGSTSSMDGRKWSASAMTDPTADKACRRTLLEYPIGPARAHSSYCGWPVGIGEVLEQEEEEGEELKQDPNNNTESEEPREMRPQIPTTLIELASPEHAPARTFSPPNGQLLIDCITVPTAPKRRMSTAVRPRLSLICPTSSQSLPNLLNESRLGSPTPTNENKAEKGEAEDWLHQMLDWSKRNEQEKRDRGYTASFTTFDAERSTAANARTSAEQRSASIGNRSVRISGSATQTSPNATAPQQANGSCSRSAKSSSHTSPLQRIRNAFRRSLLAAMDEKRRPSRQLLKRATKQMRREQKATVTLAVVLAVFLCCWVPFFALHLSNALCLLSDGGQCVHLLAMFLSTWLGYLNSSLNPLIYTVFDKRFRKAFRDLLACCLGPPSSAGGGLNRAQNRARQR